MSTLTEQLEIEKKLGVQRIELIAGLQNELEKARKELEETNAQASHCLNLKNLISSSLIRALANIPVKKHTYDAHSHIFLNCAAELSC